MQNQKQLPAINNLFNYTNLSKVIDKAVYRLSILGNYKVESKVDSCKTNKLFRQKTKSENN